MTTNEPCPCWPDGQHRRYLENEGKCQCEVEPENYPRADVVDVPDRDSRKGETHVDAERVVRRSLAQ